jgi:uncharacterized membrane protein YfcA
MQDLSFYQYLAVGLIFVWSGFVRSGLGFGGAVLSLPFLLLLDDRPQVYLPIISVHLLLFGSLTVWQGHRKARRSDIEGDSSIDWVFLRYALGIMILPKMLGVLGLITLPNHIMSGIIFTIVLIYSLSYVFNRPFKSNNKALDISLLAMGGYVSGTSLIGAPLIISVFANHVAKHKLRDTLFVLWVILVSIKMLAFIWAGIDLQLEYALYLLPAAGLGHWLGLHAHQRLLHADASLFFRVIGLVLLVISCMGLYQALIN